ncbi:MAG: hypothetical protein ACE5F5_06665 [Acidimicrobiia bacterium]
MRHVEVVGLRALVFATAVAVGVAAHRSINEERPVHLSEVL